MTDLLERLKAPFGGFFGRAARFEAACEIERLRAERDAANDLAENWKAMALSQTKFDGEWLIKELIASRDECDRLVADLAAYIKSGAQCERELMKALRDLAAAETIASFGEDERIQAYYQKWKRANDEITHLRAKLAAANAELDDAYRVYREERDQLRADLAAARALLREAQPYVERDCVDADTIARIDAALKGDASE